MENVNIIGDLKIIKRHSIGSILIGILCLLTIAVPLFYLFAPWSWFKINVVAASDTEYVSGSYLMNTMDLIYLVLQKHSLII